MLIWSIRFSILKMIEISFADDSVFELKRTRYHIFFYTSAKATLTRLNESFVLPELLAFIVDGWYQDTIHTSTGSYNSFTSKFIIAIQAKIRQGQRSRPTTA
jgi:hypothetical protein